MSEMEESAGSHRQEQLDEAPRWVQPEAVYVPEGAAAIVPSPPPGNANAKVGMLIAVLTVVMVMACCGFAVHKGSESPSSSVDTAAGESSERAPYSLKLTECTASYGILSFELELTNEQTRSDSFYLRGEVTDSGGKRLSSATGVVRDLAPGQTEVVHMIAGTVEPGSIDFTCHVSDVS